MIPISPSLSIDERELRFQYVRSSGPGGQNVNKVATAAQLRLNLHTSTLPGKVKLRLLRLAGRHISSQGILLIEARRFRTQEQNRQDALYRLIALVRRAATEPKPRRSTRPSPASHVRRLKAKKHVSEVKKSRRGQFLD